jgi:SAM-dependent MidA family methyltransferase
MHVDLPPPAAEERDHSQRVAALIRNEIVHAVGALDFARYVELALYAPGLGYYSAGSTKFGAAGDFITAPELGAVFARCLARAVASALRDAGDGADVLELGPGSGILAVELLLELERLHALPRRYLLLERSADLRARQQEILARRCAHLVDRIEWLNSPPRAEWCGVLIANEVIDALPVQLFSLRDQGLFERKVSVDADGNFVWCEQPAQLHFSAAVTNAIGADIDTTPRPYHSEICVLLQPWLLEVTQFLRQGSALFIDYGYAHGEYYAAARSEGTLRCHFRHRAHNDPLILPGVQDITAWVDFDALERAGNAVGFVVAAHTTQTEFLIAHGLDEVFAQAYEQAPDEAARYALAQQVKRLTLPTEMGERFRVMALRRA